EQLLEHPEGLLAAQLRPRPALLHQPRDVHGEQRRDLRRELVLHAGDDDGLGRADFDRLTFRAEAVEVEGVAHRLARQALADRAGDGGLEAPRRHVVVAAATGAVDLYGGQERPAVAARRRVAERAERGGTEELAERLDRLLAGIPLARRPVLEVE